MRFLKNIVVKLILISVTIATILMVLLIAHTFIPDKPVQTEIYSEPIVKFDGVLKYSECYVGDDLKVKDMLMSLPGAEFYKDNSSKIDNAPYEINIYYENFKNVEIKFENGMYITYEADELIKKNASVILARVTNVNAINVYMEDGDTYRYLIDEIRNEYANSYYVSPLDKIAVDYRSLKDFYNLYLL